MAHTSLAAPLRRCCSQHSFSAFKPRHFLLPFSLASSRNLSQARALRPVSVPSDGDGSDWEEERYGASRLADRKSRNELKREAKRAVQWGIELSKFSIPQIKRAIKVASLEVEVYEALMLVKRLGPDVREGKRRQFNYIGSLLRNAEPDLMDALIKAYKDGDTSRLLSLTGANSWSTEGEEVEEVEEASDEVVEEHVEVATRWLEGLICKDPSITKEVYAIHNIEFDRQELRRLVKKVQSVQEGQGDDSAAALDRAKRPLVRFLRSLAKRIDE
ncbi:kinesin-like protein [Rhynchospora pubera]|uniref:Kinesin-like protein n=1 Tax=Rhynchospora pubera TaxID=906938 RepID=A0AAV8CUZ0_9POAL|nr:kinesin-like protein [Rhynchospora pubera]